MTTEFEVIRKERDLSGEPIIVCRDVHKWFGDFHVLRGVSLDVQQREVIVICGPSGSGKSTFIRCINRLEEHQQGDIIVDDIELSHDVRNIEAIRRETGMVFQQFNLFPPTPPPPPPPPHPPPPRPRPAPPTARPPRPRPPKHPLPDPPTAPPPDHKFCRLVELAESGMTMLVVTHEMGFARAVADRICMFDNGEIVEQAPPEVFFTNPEHERTKLFLSQIL